MNKTTARYGTVLRLYDNGGKTADRYTILPPRWATEHREGFAKGGGMLWAALGASAEPFHPMGIGMNVTAQAGAHLGKRIHWQSLPDDVKQFARQSFPDYAPKFHCETKAFNTSEEAAAYAATLAPNIVGIQEY